MTAVTVLFFEFVTPTTTGSCGTMRSMGTKGGRREGSVARQILVLQVLVVVTLVVAALALAA